MTDKPREKKSKSCWVLDGRYFFQLESDKEINVFGSDDKRRPFDALWQKSCRHWCRVGVITAIEPRWLLFWSCGLIWYDMPMSLAWFMLEDPSITKSFHQKNLPWPSSSHHWIHQVADYLTSSHTDRAAPVCMQLLFNHRTRQDCPRDGELGCCHSTGYKDFSLFGGPWPLLHFGWVTKQLYNGSRQYDLILRPSC